MSRRGQVLVFFALALPLLLLPIAAYAAEAPMLAARRAHLAEVASTAALEAAQQLDVRRLRSGGGLALDSAAASATVAADLESQEPAAVVDSLSVSGNQVALTLHERVPLRLATFVPGAAVTLHATARANLVPGYAKPA